LGCYVIRNGETVFVPSIAHIATIDPTGCGNSATAGALFAFVEGMDLFSVGAAANISASYTNAQRGPYPKADDNVMREAKKLKAAYKGGGR
jgi:Sugar kinases, ribokinase family